MQPARVVCLFWLGWTLVAFAAVAAVAADTPPAQPWTLPPMKLPNPLKHPCIAATPEELANLKAALKAGQGDRYWTVQDVIKRAKKAAAEPLVFPPRGAQHNQWYQCDKCQLALAKIDSTHHKCSKCGTVYSGPPYDDVIFAQIHTDNLTRAKLCAWAWALTADTAAADFTAKVLLGYAERYLNYPFHDNACRTGAAASKSGGHLNEQTLGEASELAWYIAPAYDLIHDRLSVADRQKIETGLIRPMLENMDKHKAGKSNWQTWHNAAMLAGGAVMGDTAWVEKALTQKDNGFTTQMEISVTADGMWFENSWGYHFYTLMAMVELAENSRRLGIDLWSHPRLQKMFTLGAKYTMADGTLPRFADDVTSRANGNKNLIEAAWAATHDPALIALLPDKPTWDSTLHGRDPAVKLSAPAPAPGKPAQPQPLSDFFPAAGHVILRTAGPAGLTAAATFGPYGGFHGHLDKLSFVLFGYGEELGVDPGRAKSQAYRLPIHTHWYKNTLAHNAVVIDGQPQKPAEGKLDLFVAGDQFVAVRLSCAQAYSKIAQTRLLVMTPEYLLVYDTNTPADATAKHRYDWIYHGQGKTAACPLATQDGKLPDKTDGAEYLQHIKTGSPEKPDQAVTAQIVGDKVTTYLTFDAQPDTTVFTADGPFTTVDDRVPVVILERPHGTFAAVLEPVKTGAQPTVKAVTVAPGATTTLRIQRTTGVDVVTLAADNKHLTLTRDDKKVLDYAAK